MELKPIIIDNGTGYMKAGFAGDKVPKTIFPTMVGHPRHPDILSNYTPSQNYVGYEALLKERIVNINKPIHRGRYSIPKKLYRKQTVDDNDEAIWLDMETIWGYIFKHELNVVPEERNVVLTEPINNYARSRERMAEIMFEYFNVPKLYFAIQELMSLITTGKGTGLVVNIGHSVTHTVPIVENFIGFRNVHRLDIGGKDLTKYLWKLLEGRSYHFDNNNVEKMLISKIKEQLCYVSTDIDEDIAKYQRDPQSFEKTFTLPDGQTISLGLERFLCPEALFNPQLIKGDGLELLGLHEAIYKSVEKSELDLKRSLYKNIVLAGGGSMFHGLDVRIQKEIYAAKNATKDKDSKKIKVKVVAPFERDLTPWMGASIYVTLPKYSSEDIWLTAEQFSEKGGKNALDRFNLELKEKHQDADQ